MDCKTSPIFHNTIARQTAKNMTFETIKAQLIDNHSGFSTFDKLRGECLNELTSTEQTELLSIESNNSEYWRFISLHFIRLGLYEEAAQACANHFKLSHQNKEAKDREKRIAILMQLSNKQPTNTKKTLSIDIGSTQFNSSIDLMKSDLARFGRISNSSYPDFRNLVSSEVETANKLAEQESISRNDNEYLENFAKFKKLLDRLHAANTIAIVGNGSSMLNNNFGDEIDACDEVIRVNYPKINGYENDVGTKTTIIITSNQHFSGEYNIANSTNGMKNYPDVVSLVLDAAQIKETPIPKLDPKIVEKLIFMPSSYRRIIQDIGYVFSTTGLSGMIFIAILLSKKTKAFGFDFYSNRSRPYFSSNQPLEPTILHELQYEKWIACNFLLGILGSNFSIHGAT